MQQEQNNQSTHALELLISKCRDGTIKEVIEDWKWIFSYSARYKGAIVFYLILGIFSTSLGLVGSVASKYLIDIVTGYETDKLGILIGIMVGSTVFNLVFSSLISRIDLKLQMDIHNDIRADIFGKIMDADWSALNGYTSGDILNRFNSDAGTVSANAIAWPPSVVIALYRFATTFLIIAYYDLTIAALALATAPVMLLISRFVLKRQREYAKQVKQISSEVMAFEVETFYNVDTIKSFGITERYKRTLHQWQQKVKTMRLEHQLFSIKTGIFTSVLNRVIQGAAFGYCLYRLWSHEITYGTLTLFLQQRSKLSASFHSVAAIIPAFLNSAISAHRIRELVELPRERSVPCEDLGKKLRHQEFELRMRDISFSYTPEKKVINHVELVARSGEIVALVGPSGEGKTTLIRLLLGLINGESGSITLRPEGEEAVTVSSDTRQLFSYVPQGNTVFSGTVADNLRLVREDAAEEEMIAALKAACAWEFVETMPQGLDTKLGERGRGLSEGQAQRIAIARAILRDAPILLLDEATSALDPDTEQRILENLSNLPSRKICILTTHRPAVLGVCNRRYQVAAGRISVMEEQLHIKEGSS